MSGKTYIKLQTDDAQKSEKNSLIEKNERNWASTHTFPVIKEAPVFCEDGIYAFQNIFRF